MASVTAVLAECANGDGARFGLIVRAYQRKVRAIIGVFGYRNDVSEDLQQEVWLKLYRRAGTYRGEHFSAWLTSIVRSVCIDYSRACASRIKTASLSDERNEHTGEYEVADRLETEQLAEYVTEKLRSVCGHRADAIAAWLREDATTEQVASQLDVSESTIRWRAADAARRIREFVNL